MHGRFATSQVSVIRLVQQLVAPPGRRWHPSPPHVPHVSGQQ
eukprot:CAMPEP_0171463928 /NCGR_PEP_ID=MMETSP0945-20130129/7415_1 /TAXON_ID=109269 /ORGANISM="Vaucheria litorea, Strain CCMP2940" /LENGTH=41 /DNA_ID= /DNA_START= /DNA_END= /DNA_ORIENTATION=